MRPAPAARHRAATWPGHRRGTSGRVERVVHEALCRQLRSMVIAARDAVATNVQLARNSRRHRLILVIEHVELSVGDRLADTDRRIARAHPRARRPDGGFSRAIHVPQRAGAFQQSIRHLARQSLIRAQTSENPLSRGIPPPKGSATWQASPASPSRHTVPCAAAVRSRR